MDYNEAVFYSWFMNSANYVYRRMFLGCESEGWSKQ